MKKMSIAALIFGSALLGGCSTINYTAQNFVPRDAGKLSILKIQAPAYQIEDLEIKQADGAISRGVYIHKPNAEFTVLYFMGSGVRLDANGFYFSKAFTELNANIICFDYRGFGRSDSDGKAHGLTEIEGDTLAIYDDARKKVPGKLVVHGHSFGSFVAAKLASLRPIDTLVLEGTGTTARAYGDNFVPWFAKPFISVHLDSELTAIDNRAALSLFKGDLLILNGTNDVQTPAPTARELFLSLGKSNKRFLEVPDAGHMNAMSKPQAIAAYRELLIGKFE